MSSANKKEPIVIAFANKKGGCCKTTGAANIAYVMANRFGKKVLIIDADSQGNISQQYNIDTDDYGKANHPDIGKPNLGSILFPYVMSGSTQTFTKKEISKAIVHATYIDKEPPVGANGKRLVGVPWKEVEKPFGVDILPCIDIDLSLVELSLTTPKSYISKHLEYSRLLIRSLVTIIKKIYDYDVICIDSQPSLGIMTVNTLLASNNINLIMPCVPDYYSATGISQMLESIKDISKFTQSFRILGVSMNRFKKNGVVDNIINEMINEAGLRVFSTKISETSDAAKAVLEGRLLVQKNKQSMKEYTALTEEIMDEIEKKQNKAASK